VSIFENKSVLVTGATGSFGRHFVAKVLASGNPRRLVVFSRDELKQFEMQQDFPETRFPLRYFIGDVRDRERVIRACAGVDIIIHAAAMKHISAAEYNPTECIATNVIGAQNLIDAAIQNDVKQVVALSTDKAANPINLYGATKLCSDKLFVAANNLAGHHRTRFAVVRYGNVIGSRGSVIPFFKSLIREGVRTLPVTHADMTRFVITLDQGVDFVWNAIGEMAGGEVFVPKLPSVKITDLIPLMGEGLKYEVVGIRAGEKLHEIMIPLEESRNVIDLGPYYVIQPAFNWWNTEEFLDKVRKSKTARAIEEPFEYASNTNTWWLQGHELSAAIDLVKNP
jgi:UDP-N-acetylglucosamine 4,6-dehydratase